MLKDLLRALLSFNLEVWAAVENAILVVWLFSMGVCALEKENQFEYEVAMTLIPHVVPVLKNIGKTMDMSLQTKEFNSTNCIR